MFDRDNIVATSYSILLLLTFLESFSITESFISSFILTIIWVLILSVIFLAIPFIAFLINKCKQFSYKKGRWVCILNALINICITVLYGVITETTILYGIIPVLLFYVINMNLFVKQYNSDTEKIGKIECPHCGTFNKSKRERCYMCGKILDPNVENMNTDDKIVEQKINEKEKLIENVLGIEKKDKIIDNDNIVYENKKEKEEKGIHIYCTKCGKEIKEEWDFCKYCGNKNE